MMEVEKIIKEGLTHFGVEYHTTNLAALLLYMEELARWNEKINLIGIRDVERAVQELLFDAFFLKGQLKNEHSVLDLGSGSGILAIPLSIMDADMNVFSVDKSLRKVQFQRHIKRVLHLQRFTPLHGRAEEMAPIGVDSLVVKAFGSIPDILEKGGGHIRSGGRALILKGKKEDAVGYEGFHLQEVLSYDLPIILKSYKLLIYKKVS
jgi:16S rRNA (guanine527-N7)-methyltransferase